MCSTESGLPFYLVRIATNAHMYLVEDFCYCSQTARMVKGAAASWGGSAWQGQSKNLDQICISLQRGTRGYMAPELFYGYVEEARNPVTKAVDIYSFGVLIWEVVTGLRLALGQGLRQPR